MSIQTSNVMIQLRRILVPTDFSQYSQCALDYASAFAERFGSELHLLHVVNDYYPMTPDAGLILADADHYRRAVVSAAGQEIQQLPAPGMHSTINVVRKVSVGQPFVEIIRYAREHEVDLIVIGSHGRSGLSHVLMGSVAERVVRKAGCPVLTVRPGQHGFVMP
jgi:nucleotide-binding universal stress UspA family protein